jgi:hypothetical protein
MALAGSVAAATTPTISTADKVIESFILVSRVKSSKAGAQWEADERGQAQD